MTRRKWVIRRREGVMWNGERWSPVWNVTTPRGNLTYVHVTFADALARLRQEFSFGDAREPQCTAVLRSGGQPGDRCWYAKGHRWNHRNGEGERWL